MIHKGGHISGIKSMLADRRAYIWGALSVGLISGGLISGALMSWGLIPRRA